MKSCDTNSRGRAASCYRSLARFHGIAVEYDQIRHQYGTSGKPFTSIDLVRAARALEVEALVLNKDIGFVRERQAIKIDSFPFTHYGLIKGEVISISDDAVQYAPVRSSAKSIQLS